MNRNETTPTLAVIRRKPFLSGERRYILILFLLTIVLIFASKLISPSFDSLRQIRSILIISSMLAVIGFGQGIVVLLGELDLSIASVIALSGVLCAKWLGVDPTPGRFLLILFLCCLIGAVNGIGFAVLKIPSFIMTLALQMIVIGMALGYTRGTVPGAAPRFLEKLMTGQTLGIPRPILIVLAMAFFGTIIQQYTSFGRQLYAIGSNRKTSYVSGIHVNLRIINAFMLCGLFAGLTGMLLVGFAGGATLNMGEPYFLPSIAVVVVGGSSILGGSGNYLSTIAAAILLTTISTLIQALGINQGWQVFIYGLMILVILGLLGRDFSQLTKWLKRPKRVGA
jgi:ribose transport system permease protein